MDEPTAWLYQARADRKAAEKFATEEEGLLDQNTRATIKALDALAPQFPPRRNTEYPFDDGHGQWIYPAANGVFTIDEVEQFRALAYRVLDGAGRILSVIRRRPP